MKGKKIECLGLTAILVLWLIALLTACGDNGGSPTAPTAPPPAPKVPAQVTVSLTNSNVWMAWTPKRFGLAFDVTIQETAGTDVHLNYLRLEAKDPKHADRYERAEVGANDIIAKFGTNKISGKTTWVKRITWYMNLWLDGGYAFRATVDYTDVYGNHGQAVFQNDDYLNQTVEQQIRALTKQ